MSAGRGWNRQVSGLSLRRPHLIDSRKNLVFFGKTKLFQFGKNEAAIYAHFKGSTTSFNQLGFNSVLIFDRILQTCSIWKVESLSTIFNGDIHRGHSLLANKYPPAEPEVLRLLAPQRGLTAIEKSKSKTEKTTNCIIPELSNFGSPPAEPGVYPD
jgi:hypothetical protein